MYKWIIVCNLFVMMPNKLFARDTGDILPLSDSIIEWTVSARHFYTP